MTIGSLFSGIGGLEIGLESCGLGPVKWQAECDPYASAVLAKHWPTVKRYTDVRDVNEQSERVDIICGGFPCQPHSTAGKRRGTADARWLWPEFARIVGAVKPSYVFIENVPGLRTSGLRNVLADLAGLGYDATWDVFSAAEAGAPHLRERIFMLAYANGQGLEVRFIKSARQEFSTAKRAGISRNPWTDQSSVDRVAYGVPSRVDRIKCLGNAVVPQQAALAWRTLYERIQ